MTKINKRTYKKLAKAYNNQRVITCDVESFRKYMSGESKTLDLFVNEQWIAIDPARFKQVDYTHYSHTFSPEYVKKYYNSKCQK